MSSPAVDPSFAFRADHHFLVGRMQPGFAHINAVTVGISSSPLNFSDQGSWSLFFADDGTHGMQPWVTNGTSIGTFPWGPFGGRLRVLWMIEPERDDRLPILVVDSLPAGGA